MTYFNIEKEDEELSLGKKNKGINILTILTIVGSILLLGILLFGEWNMDRAYEQHIIVQEGGTTGMEWSDNQLRNSWEAFQITYEYRYEMLSLGLLGMLLCLVGAILMRKGQLKGLWIWLVGEWVPLISSLAITGVGMLQGMQLAGLIIPIAFTALYFAHKKYLA